MRRTWNATLRQGIGVRVHIFSPCGACSPYSDCYSKVGHLHVCQRSGYLPRWPYSCPPSYSLIGGVDPAKTLSVTLDVGTTNKELLSDRLYVVRITYLAETFSG